MGKIEETFSNFYLIPQRITNIIYYFPLFVNQKKNFFYFF